MEAVKRIRKVIDTVLIAAIIIYFLLMFGFTNANVVTRYGFNSPIVIANEIARYSYVAIIFLGAIFTMRADKHLSLDFFVARLPRPIYFGFCLFGRLLTEVFLVIVTYYGSRMVLNNVSVPSTAMQVPMAIIYLPMVVGSIGMLIEEAILIVVRWKQFKTHTLPDDLSAERKEGTSE